ncbi:MAG: bifunctional (p)ppGpp synthetase/guanosine-3',5'-bis(diphosphate) 3'-pyrophosphohydrolase [candidate division NC10 bacterium]|jgi:GTP pyrophosphokinase
MGIEGIVETIKAYNPEADVAVLRRAYEFAASIHQGQARRSGDPYLSHPMEVAAILTELKMDVRSIAAGFLHDAIEDTQTTMKEIRTVFGDEIADLVDGVTKLSKLPFSTREDRQAESFRKMLLAMAKDIRVIMIKLADRLHNMRTLDPLPEAKRRLIANETLEIYAPLAHRLGIAKIKQELEDLSLRQLEPEAYRDLTIQIAQKRREREAQINEVIAILQQKLGELEIPCEIRGRPKHFYSIYRKMHEQGKTFDEIYDLTAVRLLTDSLKDCYGALGVVHSLWKPIPGRFKDFIAVPKSNMYQSLHTTVVGPKGEPVEIQIRTHEMHRTAEEGIAAHWAYKEGKATLDETEQQFLWLRQLLDWGQDLKDSREFLDTVRFDLFPEEVYVFTPKGDVKALPRGSTPIDFAFSIHTDVGLHCAGARVNGRIVPLRYELRNGDIVEIVTAATQHPSRDWLKIVKSSRARSRIKAWIKNEERVRSIGLGKELLDRELRKLGKGGRLKLETFPQVLQHYGVASEEDLCAAIGYGKISPRQAVLKLLPPEQAQAIVEEETKDRKPVIPAGAEGIRIDGVDDILIHFAKCCNPLPGDEIIGFITRGRGVTIHSADCPNIIAFRFDRERQIDVQWDDRVKMPHQVKILVTIGQDRPGLLAEISTAISSTNTNIAQAEVKVTEDKRGLNTFVLEVVDLKQLQVAMQAIRRVRGVMGVERIRKH